MLFQGSDTYITLQRDYYLQVIDVENRTTHPEGTKLMYVYWNYSTPDEWASVSDEYLTCDEIHALCKGLREIDAGSKNDFSMEIYGSFKNSPFIKIYVAKYGKNIHVELSVHFPYADTDPFVSLKMTEEEWQPYLAEFLDWDKDYPISLGDQVETLVDTRDYPCGTIGQVTKIQPYTNEDKYEVAVYFGAHEWQGSMIPEIHYYDDDEVRLINKSTE